MRLASYFRLTPESLFIIHVELIRLLDISKHSLEILSKIRNQENYTLFPLDTTSRRNLSVDRTFLLAVGPVLRQEQHSYHRVCQ